MEKDTLRMQFLSGVITEGEYKEKLKENAAPIFDVVTMDGKIMVGTHQDGVGFKANKKGIEMGFEDNPKSIPNKTKIVKAKSLNESMIGGIVGIGAINQIPPRAKTDYEMAFEHFLGEKYGLNEVEIELAEMPAVDSRIKNDANFQKLVAYLKQNPDEAEDVNAEIKTLEEDWIKGDKGYSMQDGVDSTYVYFKDGKYYKRQSLSDRSGFGNTYTTDEISKEDFQKIQKEYVKEKLMKIGLGAAAVGFVGALMAGPLGANDPGNILQAALIAAGFGGAAASIFEKEEGKEVEELSLYEGEVNENVGFTIDKMLQTFEFSEKGNDEMIEFGNYLLSPEGPKNIARSIKGKLKGEGGENYFTSKPEELDAFLSKLK